MVQAVHGKYFSKKKWEYFITHRPAPGSGVSFPEIEVMLCDIPNRLDTLEEQNEADREKEGKTLFSSFNLWIKMTSTEVIAKVGSQF